MRNEDYGRIARTLADGTPVEMQAEIVNKTYPEGKTSYNTIAEIAGSDKKDEVVMLGGHLDSWHSATGATDNAIGCAIMMEAARILKTIGVQPRRTIRVALWSGEEEGLLGSLAYVKEHFGSAENPKPEFAKFAGYLNIDSGTGKRARRVGVRSAGSGQDRPRRARAGEGSRRRRRDGRPPAATSAAPTAPRSTTPGCRASASRRTAIEYGSHTHHTNLDTYERVIEDDVKASAVDGGDAALSAGDARRDAAAAARRPTCRPPAGTTGGNWHRMADDSTPALSGYRGARSREAIVNAGGVGGPDDRPRG